MQPSLCGKISVLTGATGEIGRVIARSYLEAGATLIMVGRNSDKLLALKNDLIADVPDFKERIDYVVIDNSNAESVVKAVQKIHKQFGKIDILINNAGSAGPKQLIGKIPIQKSELNKDSETLSDAMGSILCGAWMLTREFVPYFNMSASIINISTIFSKTAYFGRTAYVVPKAVLNQLSHQMALEFGLEGRGIRVNTVLPGPVESDRIHNVFIAMDELRNVTHGTISAEVTSNMILKHPQKKNTSLFVSKKDVANTLLYLGSDGSSGFTAHDFEVAHGMQYADNKSIELQTDPQMGLIDLENKLIFIICNTLCRDSIKLAIKYHESGAIVLLLFREHRIVDDVSDELKSYKSIRTIQFNPIEYKDWDNVVKLLLAENLKTYSIVVMPFSDLSKYEYFVLNNSLQQVNDFVMREVSYSVIIANNIERIFVANDIIIIYISTTANKYKSLGKIISAGVQELIRVWRHERYECNHNLHSKSIYQLIRYENSSLEHLDVISNCALWLSNGIHTPREIDIVISPEFIQHSTKEFESTGLQSISGLHLHKVALITGSSEGIGKQIARHLVLSGARVAITARDAIKLEKLKQELMEELQMTDYTDLEERILIIADADVGDPKTPTRIVSKTLDKFGKIDYLINNAGIAGEEQMVVDMPLVGWLETVKANLISNYELILLLVDHMRERKSGHILNISSHFGGLRHATVVYPNRADYALSKSGQRILAESLAEFVGPEVQINAVAPGPVEGDRIHGSVGKPGLYQRRAKLILENKRLNLIYESLISIFKEHNSNRNETDYLDEIIYRLAKNKIANLIDEPLFMKGQVINIDTKDVGSNSSKYILNKYLAKKIIKRLQLGLYLSKNFSEDKFFTIFVEDSNNTGKPFFSDSMINAGVENIREKIMHSLALQRMPSEMDVAREVVLYLSNKNVTGETMYPSCGLSIDNYVTVTEWLDDKNSNQMSKLNDAVIMIFGDTFLSEIDELIGRYIGLNAKKIIWFTRDAVRSKKITEVVNKKYHVNNVGLGKIAVCHLKGENFHECLLNLPELINDMIKEYGDPNVIISFAMDDIISKVTNELPNLQSFENLFDNTITINFVLAQRACLIDDCKTIFVMPQHYRKTQEKKNHMANAFVNLISGSSRTLTATVAKEAGLLSHSPFFYQIEPNGESSKLISAILALSSVDCKNTQYHTGMILTV